MDFNNNKMPVFRERPYLAVSLVSIAFLLVGFVINYYRAAVQRDVYARQGVKMTTWEIMWGAKPVERYIHEGK